MGPNCWVGEHVSLGRGVQLRQSVVVEGHTTLGEDTTAFAFSVIGGPPQDRKHNMAEPGESLSRLEVGARCVIREHVTINCGTCVGAGADGDATGSSTACQDGGEVVPGLTRVGDDVLLLAGAHVGHDCVIGNRVTMANYACAAGHVHVGDGAVVGGQAGIRQHVHIGELAMIGGHCAVDASVVPYGLVGRSPYTPWPMPPASNASAAHQPAPLESLPPPLFSRLTGLNLVGLRRAGVAHAHIRELRAAFDYVFAGAGAGAGTTHAALREARDATLPSQLRARDTLAERARELHDWLDFEAKGNELIRTFAQFLCNNEKRRRSALLIEVQA